MILPYFIHINNAAIILFWLVFVFSRTPFIIKIFYNIMLTLCLGMSSVKSISLDFLKGNSCLLLSTYISIINIFGIFLGCYSLISFYRVFCFILFPLYTLFDCSSFTYSFNVF